MRVVGFAIVGRYLDFQVGRAPDQALIGHDVAGWIDNESGPETLQRLPDLARTSTVLAKKLRVKIFDWIAHAPPDRALGIDVDDRRQHFRHRQDRGLSRGISLGKARCRS